MNSLIQRFRAARRKKEWAAAQIPHLAAMLSSDARWLAHDPVARALTDRYLSALGEEWFRVPFESTSNLRTRLGLDPTTPNARRAESFTEMALKSPLADFRTAQQAACVTSGSARATRLSPDTADRMQRAFVAAKKRDDERETLPPPEEGSLDTSEDEARPLAPADVERWAARDAEQAEERERVAARAREAGWRSDDAPHHPV